MPEEIPDSFVAENFAKSMASCKVLPEDLWVGSRDAKVTQNQ